MACDGPSMRLPKVASYHILRLIIRKWFHNSTSGIMEYNFHMNFAFGRQGPKCLKKWNLTFKRGCRYFQVHSTVPKRPIK